MPIGYILLVRKYQFYYYLTIKCCLHFFVKKKKYKKITYTTQILINEKRKSKNRNKMSEMFITIISICFPYIKSLRGKVSHQLCFVFKLTKLIRIIINFFQDDQRFVLRFTV